MIMVGVGGCKGRQTVVVRYGGHNNKRGHKISDVASPSSSQDHPLPPFPQRGVVKKPPWPNRWSSQHALPSFPSATRSSSPAPLSASAALPPAGPFSGLPSPSLLLIFFFRPVLRYGRLLIVEC